MITDFLTNIKPTFLVEQFPPTYKEIPSAFYGLIFSKIDRKAMSPSMTGNAIMVRKDTKMKKEENNSAVNKYNAYLEKTV